MNLAFYVLVAVAVGIAGGLQAVVNSQLNKNVDLFLTTLVVNLVATITALVLYLMFSRADLDQLRQVEGWRLLGGILGVIVVMGSTFLIPKVGVAIASSIFIVSQLAFAMIADNYGLLGINVMPINWFKFGGLALMVLGIILFFYKQPGA